MQAQTSRNIEECDLDVLLRENRVRDCQILNPLKGNELVSVLHRNSVHQRACTALISTHDTSESLRLWGLRQRPRSCPASQARSVHARPKTFYPDTAFLPVTRPVSWTGARTR